MIANTVAAEYQGLKGVGFGKSATAPIDLPRGRGDWRGCPPPCYRKGKPHCGHIAMANSVHDLLRAVLKALSDS